MAPDEDENSYLYADQYPPLAKEDKGGFEFIGKESNSEPSLFIQRERSLQEEFGRN